MTNIYLSKATCDYFEFETVKDISPEAAIWHWNAHVFELAGYRHLLLMEEQSLYSVVVFKIEPDFKLCINSFVVKAANQLKTDRFSQAQIDRFIELQDHTLAYPVPFKGREMTMINHMIGKLKKVYLDTNNPAEMKLFSETVLNRTPWKTLGFKTPVERLEKQLSR
ncbi:MAG: hypothetical protein EOO01_30815 [Chitinophagaceae bacterium]|nr:MAG: hypothetical protein EOO01_30815 [Chitinophagaceae bacterium]